MYFNSTLGSQSAYRRIYEEPIVASRQVEATETEQEIGQRRAQEVTIHVIIYRIYLFIYY